MGVYIFECTQGNWIKVGSYICKGKRPLDNPWYRIARRGFHSLRHPPELSKDDLGIRGLKLSAWYPNLGRKEEATIHKTFKAERVGEFHPKIHTAAIIELCRRLGGRDEEVSSEQKEAALRWAKASSLFAGTGAATTADCAIDAPLSPRPPAARSGGGGGRRKRNNAAGGRWCDEVEVP